MCVHGHACKYIPVCTAGIFVIVKFMCRSVFVFPFWKE